MMKSYPNAEIIVVRMKYSARGAANRINEVEENKHVPCRRFRNHKPEKLPPYDTVRKGDPRDYVFTAGD